MSEETGAERVIVDSNPVFGIEVRGYDHIPEPERNMRLRQVDLFWVGTNGNLLFFSVGTIAVSLGLNLWWAIGACLLGNAAHFCTALGSIGGARSGLPVTTLSRVAFGVRGNRPNALLAWIVCVAFEVINTIYGAFALLALFPLLGWRDAGALSKVVAVLLQLVLGGGIAVLGQATMVVCQRIFAVLLIIVLMAVFVCVGGQVDWMAAGTAHAPLSSTTLFGAFVTAAAVCAAGPLSYLYCGPDWVRYLPSATSGRGIVAHVFWSGYLTAAILGVMGAVCATLGDMGDPVGGLQPFIPGWLFVTYICAVVGGSLANSVPTYYSSGLSLQSLGVRLPRWIGTAVDLSVATAVVLYILFVQDFSAVLNDILALLVVWVGPYGGVWICDGTLRGWQYDHRAIHDTTNAQGRYWGWRGVNWQGWVAIAGGMAAAALTMKSPLFDGPVATALGGCDLNWIIGFPTSALLYGVLFRVAQRRYRPVMPEQGMPELGMMPANVGDADAG